MKKRNTKRLLAMLLTGCLSLGMLAACSPEEGANPSSVPSDGENTQGVTQSYELEELGSGEVKWTQEETEDGWIKVTNEGGATLGYSPDSGVALLQHDGYAFKDLNQNGALDAYEDWRLDAQTRAENLASLMTPEEQLPLMFVDRYDTNYIQGEINDTIKGYLDAGVRGLSTPFAWPSTEAAIDYTNLYQSYVESLPYGIPIDLHGEAGNGLTSAWANNLALAATFDPEIVAAYAQAMSEEYRALGITTTLTPQIDIASEPRWSRIADEFGEDPALVRDMAVAYVNGLQSTYDENGEDLGWGEDSVNTEMKHFPGDGPGESGRESHNFYGAYTVYPGDNFYTHLIPFQACLELPGKTGSASGVMPSYSIAVGSDGKAIGGEATASGYNEFKLTELLREDMGFEGLISSDFIIVEENAGMTPRIWGVEDLTVPERRLLAVMSGLDQFGGEANVASLLEAYELGVEEYGEDVMSERINGSAVRILKNMFQIGLFENPYLDKDESLEVINSEDKAAAGYEALQKSIVMLKNSGNIISAAEEADAEKPTVYIPMTNRNGTWSVPLDLETVREYFNVVTDTVSGEEVVRASAADLAACDFALVRIQSPQNVGGGYDSETETYIPLSLQYGEYTANSDSVRLTSIAGDEVEVTIESPYGAQTVYETENRSYFGNTAVISNASDLDAVLYAAEHVDQVIVSVTANNPMVFSEFESEVDAILMDFTDSNDARITQAVCEVVTGQYEPSGLLPLQMPANMETVEAQYEDVPRDMECYVDSEGNTYDFTFGLNWSGVISDERTEKYNVPALVG